MKGRGRPPKTVGERRYPNRLRELRQRLGWSQQQVAAQAGISPAYYGALERGDKRINADTARRLEIPLQCAVGELFAAARSAAVPLRYVIAAAESESRPAVFAFSEPYEWIQAGRLADPVSCFAAEIIDDSADLDFAPGTVLFVRALTQLGGPLSIGAKIVVRFFLDRENPDTAHGTYEILYGILDQNVLGDLILITRSRNRLVPRHALIRAATPSRSGLEEAPLVMRQRAGTIEYAPTAGDPGEILGVVVYRAGPA